MRAAGHGEEVASLYRAVAKAELDDIAQAGFRQHPNSQSLESKLFATSPEDAARFGRDNFRFDDPEAFLPEQRSYGRSRCVGAVSACTGIADGDHNCGQLHLDFVFARRT